MPTIVSHALVPLTIGAIAGRRRIAPAVAWTGALLAMAPDLDVIGFRLGIAYDAPWGHRGATHSLLFAAMAVFAIMLARRDWRWPPIALFLFAAMASHGLLDTMTDGGRGVALLWPFDSARWFAPWRPIRVAPIGARFFSSGGMASALSELQWIWLPCLMALGATQFLRNRAKTPL